MRWQRLFADIEAELDGAARVDMDEEVVVQTRRRRGQVGLLDRLRIERARELDIRVRGAGRVRGVLSDIGSDWLLLNDDAGGEVLVPMPSVLGVFGLGRRALRPGPQANPHSSPDLRYALKMISQDRSHVRVTLSDGSSLAGMVDWVGADFVDVIDHGPDADGGGRDQRAATVALVEVGLLRRV